MIRIAITALALAVTLPACSERPSLGGAPVVHHTSDAIHEDVRFTPLEIALEVNEPLAAYQVELIVKRGEASIVGVEGGALEGFVDPPYYDPAALAGGRIVLGAFSTSHVLRRGRHRVAVVHMSEIGPAPVEYELELVAAASATGTPVAARPAVGAVKGDSR